MTPSLRLSVSSSLPLWLFTALGILTKGPITPMVVVLTALTLAVLSRKQAPASGGRAFQPAGGKHPGPGGRAFQPAGPRWLLSLHPLLGLLIAAAAVGPWVYAVAQQVGFASYWQIVSDEVFARAGSAKEGHWGPPGYHLVLLVVLFWPGSLLTGLSIGRAWRRGLRVGATHGGGGGGDRAGSAPSSLRRSVASSLQTLRSLRITRRPEAFLLAWMLPSWLVFELVGTKLPHYTMPLYPAVALITARGLLGWASLREGQRRRAQLGAWVWATVGCALLAVVVLGVLFSIGGPAAFVAVLLLPFALILGIAALAELKRNNLPAAQQWSIPAAVLMLVSFLASAAPGFFGMTQWAHDRAEVLAGGGPVTWVGLREDSLVWFGRGRPDYTEPEALMAWFDANPTGVAVVSVYAEDSYRSHPVELWVVEYALGYHYTKGRLDKLALVERLPPE